MNNKVLLAVSAINYFSLSFNFFSPTKRKSNAAWSCWKIADSHILFYLLPAITFSGVLSEATTPRTINSSGVVFSINSLTLIVVMPIRFSTSLAILSSMVSVKTRWIDILITPLFLFLFDSIGKVLPSYIRKMEVETSSDFLLPHLETLSNLTKKTFSTQKGENVFADPRGFEPLFFSVTGRRVRPGYTMGPE